jgi:hypothetical protein
MKLSKNVRPKSLGLLLLNTVLAIIVLFVLITTLSGLGLLEYTTTSFILTSIGFIAIAFLHLFIRITEASRLGYKYYYEHSLSYAILSFIVNARFYGFFPALYLGGSKITADRVGRVGSGDIGPNHEDLYSIAALPVQGSIAVCLALIPAVILTQSSFLTTTGFLLASYAFFTMIPWPYSNGLHILSYDTSSWLFYAAANTVLVVTFAVL